MVTKKTATYRTDLLGHEMNAGKEVRVRQLLSVWRKVACMHLKEQWSLFVRSGKVNKQLKSSMGSHLINAARVHQHRRSMPLLREGRHSRRQILSLLVRQHRERFTSARGCAADPKLTNPYFKEGVECDI
jgi:hypothetical protein